MFTVADRWIMGQLAFASLIATVVMTGPVIMVSILTNLPDQALYSSLLWPSLSSIGPMILYHTLPGLVAIAIVWCYGELSSNGALAALHMTGRSIASVRAPAILVALAAAIIGYVTSTIVAPYTAGHLHDVLYAIRHNADPSLLVAGKFNVLSREGEVVYFKKRLGREFADVFVVKKGEDGERRAYIAQRAVHSVDDGQNLFWLLDGSVQITSPRNNKQEMVEFHVLSLPLNRTAASARTHHTVDELDTLQFLRYRGDATMIPSTQREWMREAANRFVIPGLVLIYTLLGLELLTYLGLMTDRKRGPVTLICAAMGFLHFVTVVAIEQIGLHVEWSWAVAALIFVELAVVLVLTANRSGKKQGAFLRWPRSLRFLQDGADSVRGHG